MIWYTILEAFQLGRLTGDWLLSVCPLLAPLLSHEGESASLVDEGLSVDWAVRLVLRRSARVGRGA